MPSLKAMPGRVVLTFAKPVEKQGLIHIPQTSQLRPEFGTIADIGEPLTEEERRIAVKLKELQAEGKKIAVSFAAGVSFWRDYDSAALGGGDWSWLKDAKAYRISELAAFTDGYDG